MKEKQRRTADMEAIRKYLADCEKLCIIQTGHLMNLEDFSLVIHCEEFEEKFGCYTTEEILSYLLQK